LVTRSMTPKCMTRVPTQITCRIFKQHPYRKGHGGFARTPRSRWVQAGGGSIATYVLPSTLKNRFISLAEIACFCALRPLREGAQYSRRRGAVNDNLNAPRDPCFAASRGPHQVAGPPGQAALAGPRKRSIAAAIAVRNGRIQTLNTPEKARPATRSN
jgi:hypothetical protein